MNAAAPAPSPLCRVCAGDGVRANRATGSQVVFTGPVGRCVSTLWWFGRTAFFTDAKLLVSGTILCLAPSSSGLGYDPLNVGVARVVVARTASDGLSDSKARRSTPSSTRA